jgi:uncharacterized protein
VARTQPRTYDPGAPELGRTDGLAWALFPAQGGEAPAGGVVVLHGAGSAKESHFDFARLCAAAGLAALCFDARGHGASDGPMDGRVLADVAAMAGVVRERGGARAVGLRGSSMGGFCALAAAEEAFATAVVAICPASGDGLARGLRAGRFPIAADAPAVERMLAEVDLRAAARAIGEGLLLQHAEGDEVVPVEHSRALHAVAPGSGLVVVPGGHHRSVQHDPELQAGAVRFLARRLAARGS